MKKLTYLSALVLLVSCTSSHSQKLETSPSSFNSYWYGGQAELSSYQLQQARYGEIHEGEAVLVFVTEPFSRSKQVKLDNARAAASDNTGVLKLNMTKKFLTGIYPYSMMMSSFSPVSLDRPSEALKVTTSSQEWCGHTFMQLNKGSDDYKISSYSYFESEGDQTGRISDVILEDELWTQIRLNPEQLPQGKMEVLPGTFYLRLRHEKVAPVMAQASLTSVSASSFSDEAHSKYELTYEGRTLAIYFETRFPYTILGWEDTYLSGFGRAKELKTTARRIKTIKSSYWNQHKNADRKLRRKLGLTEG